MVVTSVKLKNSSVEVLRMQRSKDLKMVIRKMIEKESPIRTKRMIQKEMVEIQYHWMSPYTLRNMNTI